MHRRSFLSAAGLLSVISGLPRVARAQARAFAPALGPWRTFEVVTRLDVIGAGPDTRAWVPVPNVNTDWQQSMSSEWSGNASSTVTYTDPASDARMVCAQWAQGEGAPKLEVVSTIRTRDRVADWKTNSRPTGSDLDRMLKPTALIPRLASVLATSVSVPP